MEQANSGTGSLLSAMFLVAGCCIGGGMLALPVATGMLGFAPSMFMMLLCWATMTATGLLLVEASLWLEEGAHVVTMAMRLLGPAARVAAWLLYLYIGYASLVAYTSAGGDFLGLVSDALLGVGLSKALSCITFVLIFGAVLYLGNQVVGRVNSILFMGLIAAYVGLLVVGIPEVDLERLRFQQWGGATLSVPLLLTAFSYQTIVPSLTPYLKRNIVHLRMAVVGGTSIALIIYVVWEALILGIVPVEDLMLAHERGLPATQLLLTASESPWVQQIASFFAFFALVTSFLAIAMGLFDFLSDGLNIPRVGWGEAALALVVVVPTLFFAVGYERAFLVALDTSGGIGDSLLNGIIPVMMVWSGRYYSGYGGVRGLDAGKPTLVAIGIFFLFSALQEVFVLTGAFDMVTQYIRTLDF